MCFDVYVCLWAKTRWDTKVFFMNFGKWYKVKPTCLQAVNWRISKEFFFFFLEDWIQFVKMRIYVCRIFWLWLFISQKLFWSCHTHTKHTIHIHRIHKKKPTIAKIEKRKLKFRKQEGVQKIYISLKGGWFVLNFLLLWFLYYMLGLFDRTGHTVSYV